MDFKFKSSQTRDHYHKLKCSPRLLIGALNQARLFVFVFVFIIKIYVAFYKMNITWWSSVRILPRSWSMYLLLIFVGRFWPSASSELGLLLSSYSIWEILRIDTSLLYYTRVLVSHSRVSVAMLVLIKGIRFHIRLIKEGYNILSVWGGLIDVVILAYAWSWGT